MITLTTILISIAIIIFAICLFYPTENFDGNFARIQTDNGLLNKVIQQAGLKTNPMSAQAPSIARLWRGQSSVQ